MRNSILAIGMMLSAVTMSMAQVKDTTYTAIDSSFVSIDTTTIIESVNAIHNAKALNAVFEKLQHLSTSKKQINIVHIGDSHIQADFFSGAMRKSLQTTFGNAGRGFVFPVTLARTNGIHDVRFSSNITWDSQRVIYPNTGNPVGLSGLALFTKNKTFAIEMTVRGVENEFKTLKIITPQNQKMFDVAMASKTIVVENAVPKKVIHKIKNGEALSIIADKYNVSVTTLKKTNGLKTNAIRAGKTLTIPTNQTENRKIERSEFIPLESLATDSYHYLQSDVLLNKIYLVPNKEAHSFELNGLVLENDNSGILYHSIGINGAKCSDYNKYPLFFEQIPVLNPDLVIISLGTNESFDKMSSTEFLTQLDLMIQNIRQKNPEAQFLITTPPPSLFKRKHPNVFVAAYAKDIVNKAEDKNYAVWDMYAMMGGLFSVHKNYSNGLMSPDRVHYSKTGYEKQGQYFFEAFLNAFVNFKSGQ
jgi:LysM repeat protein/lysophospholipase L1-like esterase